MNDPIQGMPAGEIQDACEEILGSGPWSYQSLIGVIILKLQQWGCRIICHAPKSTVWELSVSQTAPWISDTSLEIAFLRTAQALGHWSPPKKVEAFYYWRNKISGSIVEMRPEFIASMATHPEEWQRVTVTPYKEDK